MTIVTTNLVIALMTVSTRFSPIANQTNAYAKTVTTNYSVSVTLDVLSNIKSQCRICRKEIRLPLTDFYGKMPRTLYFEAPITDRCEWCKRYGDIHHVNW